MFNIILKYDDGSEIAEELSFGNLRDAAVYALGRADQLSVSNRIDEQQPTQIRIQRGDHLEFAISLRGWRLDPH